MSHAEILSEQTLGRRPFLQVIIDLTTLEKVGKFKVFENLIRVYNGKRGLHACCSVSALSVGGEYLGISAFGGEEALPPQLLWD